MNKHSTYITISAYAGILAAVTDIVSTVIYSFKIPGYSWLHDTVSKLGSSASPVSGPISALWIFIGILLIFFGTGFKKAFSERGKNVVIAMWLIILYGFGEGIGSGLFKADRIANQLTISGIIHEIFGGIGVISILLFPLVMLKIIPENEYKVLYSFAKFVFYTAILFILLFLFRFSGDQFSFISDYKGLWQRAFILISYIYLIRIALLMIFKQKQLDFKK